MNAKDKKRHYAYEGLILLLCLAALLFICRLWPILLLVILGIFIAMLRLVFLSAKKVEEPKLIEPAARREPVITERDERARAYAEILRRITELVTRDYPEARWIWESPRAKNHIEAGEDVYILLNRAGGYRRARVSIRSGQVTGLAYETVQPRVEPTYTARKQPEPKTETPPPEPVKEDYGLLAFEWVESHIMELNNRCNEAIGRGKTELLLPVSELPVRESWAALCEELEREGLDNLSIAPEGINIKLTD